MTSTIARPPQAVHGSGSRHDLRGKARSRPAPLAQWTPALAFATLLAFASVPPLAAQAPSPVDGKRVTLRFDGESPETVVAAIAEQTGLPCVLHESLQDQGSTVYLRLENASLRSALDLLCADLGGEWTVAAGSGITLAEFGFLDRTVSRSLDLRAEFGWDWSAPDASTEPTAPRWLGEGDLESLIKDHVALGTWDEQPRSLTLLQGILTLRHLPEVVDEALRLVRGLARLQPRPVELTWGFVETAAGPSPAETQRFPDRAAAEAWRTAAGRRWRAGQSVTLRALEPGQTGAWQVLDTGGPADPARRHTTLTADAWCFRSAGRDRVLLRAELDCALARREDDPAAPADVQAAGFTFDLADGEAMAVPLARSEGMDRSLFVAVRMPPAPPIEPDPPVAAAPRDPAIDAAFAKVIQLDFTDCPIPDVVDFLREFLRINFHIPREVREEDRRATFQVEDVPVERALDAFTHAAGLRWRVANDVIVFASGDLWEPTAPATWIDIRDLTAPPFHTRPCRLIPDGPDSVRAQQGEFVHLEAGEAFFTQADAGMDEAQQLADLVRMEVEPASWDERSDQVSLATAPSALLVTHTADVVSRIAALIDARRAGRPHPVALEVALADVPATAELPPVGEARFALAEAWWRGEQDARLLWSGALAVRTESFAWSAGILRQAPAPGAPPPLAPQRAFALQARLGALKADGTLAVDVRLEFEHAGLTDPARVEEIARTRVRHDGSVDLAPGRVHAVFPGALGAGRQAVLLLRWRTP